MNERITAIILAAGSGSRMMSDKTKQMMDICGQSVLRRAALAFEAAPSVGSVIVVVRADETDFARDAVRGLKKAAAVICGGETRQESARLGFLYAEPYSDYVAVHDAARCLVTPEMIEAVIADAVLHGAATASSAVTDTVKRVGGDGCILATVDRTELRAVQTPQIFKTELYRMALEHAERHGLTVTDDNMLLESIGVPIFCTDTGKENIKITTPDDITLAEYLLNRRNSDV